MSLGARDQEALDLVVAREFGAAYVVAFDLEMQARRLTLAIYGALRPGDATTYAATVTFFGATALCIDNASGTFPESVRIDALELAYSDVDDVGTATLRGRGAWEVRWRFDGIAYEEHPAAIASLADDS